VKWLLELSAKRSSCNTLAIVIKIGFYAHVLHALTRNSPATETSAASLIYNGAIHHEKLRGWNTTWSQCFSRWMVHVAASWARRCTSEARERLFAAIATAYKALQMSSGYFDHEGPGLCILCSRWAEPEALLWDCQDILSQRTQYGFTDHYLSWWNSTHLLTSQRVICR